MADRIFNLGPIRVVDFQTAQSPAMIARDVIRDDRYGLARITFAPDDTVLDIGANVGIVSALLAVRHPALRVLALEPNLANLAHLEATLALNGEGVVGPMGLAVTRDRREVEVAVDEVNTGGGSIYNPTGVHRNTAPSVRLNDLWPWLGLDRVRLLKMDIEGAEYEALTDFDYWGQVDYVAIETHPAPAGYSREDLMDLLHARFSADRLFLMEA